ncbi:MAG: SPFH/Band 7/PHB domain protein [Alphaproteobacteria bacterium]|nr:SPFH/Band 7/PHB domain protein [Alphaproteobacteria bacterium]MCL2505441.1 SPFH/Band 7/PHB domain protein [Alphaproteobacteria bacterium]
MEGGQIFILFLLVLVVIGFLRAVRIVPQGEEWIIERLGKYDTTFLPGLNIMVPFIDRIASKVITKDIMLNVPEQEVITKDNALLTVNAISFVKVTNPVKAVYGIVNFAEGIRNLIMTSLRSIIGEMELDVALSSRDHIKAKLRENIANEVLDWGLTIKSVEIQDIKPSASMQKSMEMQAASERERKAVVTRAEGDKQSMILQAEARLESARRDAEAQVTLAKASAEAIQRITETIGTGGAPMTYLLGEKYIRMMEKMSDSSNSKLVIVPADIQETVRGFFGRN